MVTPFVEDELADALESNVATLNSTNLRVGAFQDSPGDGTLQAVIFNLGGETEGRFRFRIMTRADDYRESVELANEIYDFLHRLNNCTLVTIKLYMVTGQRPQQSGKDESNRYLTSADYLMEFSKV